MIIHMVTDDDTTTVAELKLFVNVIWHLIVLASCGINHLLFETGHLLYLLTVICLSQH